MATNKNYVLYVNDDNENLDNLCPGSQICASLLDGCTDVHVQHVVPLIEKGIDLPEWLDGTPCLVDKKTSQAYRGTAAVNVCKTLKKKNRPRVAPSKPLSKPRVNQNTERMHTDVPPPAVSTRVKETNHELMGVVSAGEKLHLDNEDEDIGYSFQMLTSGNSEEAPSLPKVTGDMLERYMATRNANNGGENQ